MRDHTHPATAFHAMALVAAARTALATARAVADRRAGRDPSGQEDGGRVRDDLTALVATLSGLTARLRLRAAVGAPSAPAAALAQAFEDRLLLAELGREVRRSHQKLLSLYPAVSEDTVEQARVLMGATERLATDAEAEDGLGALADRLADWLDTFTEEPK